MAADVEDFYTEQGATFTYGFVLYIPTFDGDGNLVLDVDGNPDLSAGPMDLTGCTLRIQIRDTKAQDGTLYVTGTSEDFDEAHPFGGRIVVTPLEGRIDIILTDADTDLLTIKKLWYDLELEWPLQPGELRPHVDRIMQGKVINDINVTDADTGGND